MTSFKKTRNSVTIKKQQSPGFSGSLSGREVSGDSINKKAGNELFVSMIDINVLRVEKGGNPELVRESQRKRGANVQLVDDIIQLDKDWVKCKAVEILKLGIFS